MSEQPNRPIDPGADRSVQDALHDAQAAIDSMELELVEDEPPQPFGSALQEKMEMLGDVDLDVTIELGRANLLVEEVLKLQDGSVVELDKLAGDPVEVFVNGKRVARGEVLILNEDFCIRISEIDSACEDRINEVLEEVNQQAT